MLDVCAGLLEICVGCQLWKQHWLSFDTDNKTWQAKGVLDLLHVDLHGPMKTPTISRAKYFLLLVDDFSRKMRVCFMNNKSNCCSKFVTWKSLVEKQTSKQLKALGYDNGGEFVST